MNKIMFVDDEEDLELLMRQRFRRQLRAKEFEFYFARSGIEALKLLEKEPDIRLVVSDINMPEMDGLTLLKNINQQFPDVIAIIVSAYGDMSNIRAAMNLGAFDFVTKPINFDDLNLTINKTFSHIQYLINSEKTRSQLDTLLYELNVAASIQQSILPKKFIKNDFIELYANMTAAKEIGGDFYDFFWLDDKKLAFVMADVSGKGVPAALFMTVSRTLLRAHASKDMTTGASLMEVNNALQQENTNMMFVTTFYAVLDVESGQLTYTNGGHNPPCIIRKGGNVELLDKRHGMALGIMDNVNYGQDIITLLPGDAFFTYTDGVTEAENEARAQLGEKKLVSLLEKYRDLSAEELVNTIGKEIVDFASGFPQSDDITMLAVRYFKNQGKTI